jgi:hypothetical protein
LLARQVDKGDTQSKRNDRIVAIAQASFLFAEVRELADLPAVILQQIEDFFVDYQKVREVEVTPLGARDRNRHNAYLRRLGLSPRPIPVAACISNDFRRGLKRILQWSSSQLPGEAKSMRVPVSTIPFPSVRFSPVHVS